MTDSELQKLRYPIGEYAPNLNPSQEEISEYIGNIESFPERISNAVKNLSNSQLDTPYREDGWTVKQVVHHVVDSHINGYCRFKFALTEDTPSILPYNEADWAELPEAKNAPVELSLNLLAALHKRFVLMLRAISHEQLSRKMYHPESKTKPAIGELIGLYSWHCDHHLAHITGLKNRMGWQ